MKHRLLSCIESRVENNRNFYGRFQLGPFDLGQGITVANSLRRSLLSEVLGLAITAIEIRGATHEYSNLPGVRESVLDILLNLKQIVLTSDFQIQKPQIGYLQVEGPGIVRANDLKLPISIQCVDPEQHIATLVSNGSLKMKFMICRGRTFLFQKPLGLQDRSKPLHRSFRQKIKKSLTPVKTPAIVAESKATVEDFQNTNFASKFEEPFFSDNSYSKVNETRNISTNFDNEKLNNGKNLINITNSTQQKSSIFTFVDGGSFLNKINNSSSSTTNISQKFFNTFATTKDKNDFDLSPPLLKSENSMTTNSVDLKNSDTNFQNFSNQYWNALPIDSVFMPVNKVNFAVEIDNDYDVPKERVILEVWTNGSIHPRQAIHEAAKALIKLILPFQETKRNLWLEPSLKTIFFNSPKLLQKTLQKRKKNLKYVLTVSQKDISEMKGKNITSLDIGNLDLSLRPYTCLKQAKIETVADLLKYSREELLSFKNFGKRSLDEVENNLNQLGLKLRTPSKNL
jgi:DNA-directed RNA polymerase alpha subunit